MADHMYKLSEIPKKQRLAHFWEYYKVPAIFTAVIAVIIISFIYSIFLAPKPDASVLFISSGVETLESFEMLEEELHSVTKDYNGDKKTTIDLNTVILDSSNEIDFEHYTAASQKLTATLASDAYIIQIVDEHMFDYLKNEEIVGTYKEFTGYNTEKSEDELVKIPLSALSVFEKSPALLTNDYYITIRDRYSSHIEGNKRKTKNYENHIDMFAEIAGFEKIS